METITFLNNACHLSDSESGSKAGTSPLMFRPVGQGHPCTHSDVVSYGMEKGENKKK